MNLRETAYYKQLTPYMATSVAEGFCEGEGASNEEQLCAWQYIHDKGMTSQLQGFFGRTVRDLIEEGSIQR